jgi:hypothetical protein
MYIICTAIANKVKDRFYTEVLSTVQNVRLTLYFHGIVEPNFRTSNIVRVFFVVDG